jgi:hypothetical protein
VEGLHGLELQPPDGGIAFAKHIADCRWSSTKKSHGQLKKYMRMWAVCSKTEDVRLRKEDCRPCYHEA